MITNNADQWLTAVLMGRQLLNEMVGLKLVVDIVPKRDST